MDVFNTYVTNSQLGVFRAVMAMSFKKQAQDWSDDHINPLIWITGNPPTGARTLNGVMSILHSQGAR